MILRSAALFLTSLLVLGASAQQFRPLVENFTPKEYGRYQTPENWCVAQAPNGLVYVGNSSGLLEYDGHDWRHIPVKEGAFITSVDVTSDGTIFLGAVGDFGQLVEDEKGNLRYRSLYEELTSDPQEIGVVWKTWAAENKIYFQTYEQVFVYENGGLEVLNAGTSFHTSFLVGNSLYVRQREKGLMKLGENGLSLIPGTEVFEEYGLFGLHQSEGGDLLLVTQELGLFKYSADLDSLLPLNPEATDYFNSLGIVQSERLSDGNIAMATLGGGVVVVTDQGEIVAEFDKKHGLRSDEVKYLTEDLQGNLWLATANGVSKVEYGSELSYYSEGAGLPGRVEAIRRFQGRLYVGTSAGLFVQSDAGAEDFQRVDEVHFTVWSLEEYEGNLYVGGDQGLFVLNAESGTLNQLYQANTHAMAFLPELNYLVLAGALGVTILEANTYLPFQELPAGFGRISGIAVEQVGESYRAWIGAPGYGVLRLDVDDFGFDHTMYTEEDGVDVSWVTPVKIKDRIVLTTAEGLYTFEEEALDSTSAQDWNAFQWGYELNGRTFVHPLTILEPSGKGYWVLLDYAVTWMDSHGELTYKPFVPVDVNRINTLYAEGDELWIGGTDALVHYSPRDRKPYDRDFSCLIRSMTVTGDSIVHHGAGVFDGQWSLGYEDNDVTFAFSAPYFTSRGQMEYSWMLKGKDTEWGEWKLGHEAVYTNLPEGDYVFMVKARNVFGEESMVAQQQFTILPPWYRTGWAYTIGGLVLILAMFGLSRLRTIQLKRKNQRLEETIAERTQEIVQKNEILKQQKDEITDSINYARRIQDAILPSPQQMSDAFEDAFVVFKPKDIVSGDFYWMEKRGEVIYYAAADCTGHGVPGAMVSVICSNALHKAVVELGISDPGLILNKVREFVIDTFDRQHGTTEAQKEQIKDGMDIALCSVDLETRELHYAGANNPLWLVRATEEDFSDDLFEGEVQLKTKVLTAAGYTLVEISASKQPVGRFAQQEDFSTQMVKLRSGDCLYTFSDGFADQFGGDLDKFPGGKKFKYKPFKQLLCTIQDASMPEQRQILEKVFEDWKGELEQVDDVCVIGVKV